MRGNIPELSSTDCANMPVQLSAQLMMLGLNMLSFMHHGILLEVMHVTGSKARSAFVPVFHHIPQGTSHLVTKWYCVDTGLTHLLWGLQGCHWQPPPARMVPPSCLKCQSGCPSVDPVSHLVVAPREQCSSFAYSTCCQESICRLQTHRMHDLRCITDNWPSQRGGERLP